MDFETAALQRSGAKIATAKPTLNPWRPAQRLEKMRRGTRRKAHHALNSRRQWWVIG
jgi:hypothetical protein